ncbi:MAG: retroviral-like aspartic protease family protein [Chitinophagaceae bacterium]|nr:retroviral-like aspartic protease family protein [Chitinophagaceae bacterium]
MKKSFLLGALLLLIYTAQSQIKDNLYQLYEDKQFPALHLANTDVSHPYYYFYKAVYANACNRPDSSLQYLQQFLGKKKTPPSELAFAYYKLENDNYVRSFRFAKAESTGVYLTKKFKNKFTADELKGNNYANMIWKALKKQPVQKIEQPAADTLPFKRDLAGLINIKVTTEKSEASFVFDTGAGLSTITDSYAEKMGLIILPDSGIQVSGFNDIYNPVRIGIAPKLQIGNIIVYNEPFLIFQDEAFSFANGAYKINGIIGFPIAKELGRITIEPNQLVVNRHDKEDASLARNFFMETLRPVLMMEYKGKLLPFNFDTGANGSTFTGKFYNLDSTTLLTQGQFVDATAASAGGATTNRMLKLPKLEFLLNGKIISFADAQVDPGLQEVSDDKLYGNIGQDILRQYKKVILDFGNSYFGLEN